MKIQKFLLLSKKSFSTMTSQIPTIKPSHPEYGNLKEIAEAGGFSSYLFKKHQELGDTFYFWGKNEKILSLGHPKYFSKLNSFNLRPELIMSYRIPIFGETISTAQKIDRKGKKKKVYNSTFDKEVLLAKHFEVFERNMAELTKELLENPKNIDIEKKVAVMIGNCTIEVMFGEKGVDRNAIIKSGECFKACYRDTELQFCGANFDEKKKKEIQDNIDYTRNFVVERIENWQKRGEEGDTYLDVFGSTDFQENLNNTRALYYSSVLTMTKFLTGAFFLLSKNQNIQKKLQDELISNFGEKEVTVDSLKGNKYLKACFKEILRCHHPTSTLKRQCTERVEYEDGLVVEKGSIITVPLNYVFRNEKFWEDPNTFRPERFLENPIKFPLIQFLPFGFGDRLCPGKSFAELLGYFVLGRIIKNFKVNLSKDGNDNQQKVFIDLFKI